MSVDAVKFLALSPRDASVGGGGARIRRPEVNVVNEIDTSTGVVYVSNLGLEIG